MAALLGSAATTAQAQRIRLDVRSQPLPEALSTLRTQMSVDVVYAQRLVEGTAVSCQYTGNRAEEALACLLRDTNLRAQQVRRRQYVLVDHPAPASAATHAIEREQLAGFVIDAELQGALPGAHIYLTGLQVGTTTNRAGYFVFPSLPPGRYAARVSFLGYEARDTTLATGPLATHIRLESRTLESDGVLIEGVRDEGSRKRMPGMLSVELDQLNQMPALGEQDLFQALRWSPGIRKSGVINGGLSVRGGQPDQNLYLLDGAPIYHPWHAFSLVSTFQTGTLKSSNLYRSAFPAEHGGRLSAVLDAQMKDGDRSEPHVEAALSVLSGRFRVESPVTESVSLMLSARRSYVDMLIGRTHPVQDATTGRRDTLRTGYYFYDMSGKLTARPSDRHRLSLSYYRGRDDLDLRLPFDLSLDFSSWLRPADLFFEVKQSWENQMLSAQHQYMASDRLFVTTTAYHSGYRANEGSFVQPTTTASLTSDYHVDLRDRGVKVTADYYHSVAHEVKVGFQVAHQRFGSTLYSDLQRSSDAVDTLSQQSDLRAAKLIAHAQDTWKPAPRWKVQPGVRMSYFSSGKHLHVRPRLNARYTVHPDHLVVRAAGGAHVQYLHRLRDRYSLAYDLVSSRWIPSNARVRPATSWQVSLGMQSNPWSDLTLELTTYGRRAEHVLIPRDVYRTKDGLEGPGIEVGALRGQYVPTGERAWGGELNALYEHGPWRVQLGLARARSWIEAPPLEGGGYRPADLDMPYSLRTAVSRSTGRWEAVLAGEVRSGYPHAEPTARYELGDLIGDDPVTYLYRPRVNNGRLPQYARIDAALGYHFQWLAARWKAKVSVYNLTNRRNTVSRQYVPAEGEMRVNDRRGLPLLPLIELEMNL
jgi:hypothetical protein